MTLDEAIEQFKYDAECNRTDLDLSFAEDNDKIAEWLEELKAIKSDGFTDDLLNMGFTKGYNKAIDDFSERIKQVTYTSGTESDGYYKIHAICERDIDEIAEQLKAGDGE